MACQGVRLEMVATVTGKRTWEEEEVYRLFRFNNSGNIAYHDQIKGKEDRFWRTLANYRFNQETLDWTKLKV